MKQESDSTLGKHSVLEMGVPGKLCRFMPLSLLAEETSSLR